MTPAMYIFVNKGLGMSAGKMAAQASHAAVEAYRISMGAQPHKCALELGPESNIVRRWYRGGHYMKLVMECRDGDHLLHTAAYLKDRGFNCVVIYDEGHTEVDHIVPTALGVEILDKDDPHAQATFGGFDLYRDGPPPPPPAGTYPKPDPNMGYRVAGKRPPRCGLPPRGWYCSLPASHDGPCPTHRKRRLGLSSLGEIKRWDRTWGSPR